MKKTVRLTESELKTLIVKSVKKALKESKQYLPNAVYVVFDGTSHYAVYGCDVEDEILNNDAEVVKGPFAKWDDKVDQIIDDLNDEANGVKYDRRLQNIFETRNKANKLTNKILEQVKGKIKKAVKLNEEYYPDDDDMMDDYYYGAMMTFSIEGMFDDLSEETIQNLVNTNEEYCENSNSYCSVMVTKVNVQPDEFGDYEITVEAAVSAPEMPIDAIEEDAQDQIWYWFDSKTGARATRVVITDEREVFDHRTEKYK